MKLFTLFISLFFLNNLSANTSTSARIPMPPVGNDTMVFDLKNATVSTAAGINYLDLPMSIITTTSHSSFDFWFKFNEAKLTFLSASTTIPSLDQLTYFNTTDHFLRNTTSGPSTAYVVPANVTLVTLRFQLATYCTDVDTTDFNSITSLLDGLICTSKFTSTPPKSLITVSSSVACKNSTINFSYPNSILGRAISTWSWNFGDGSSTSALQNPNHTYTSFGNFTAQLTVTTTDGCTYSLTQPMTIVEPPLVNFLYAFNASLVTTDFTNTSTVSSGTIVSYSWNFGDGGSSTLQNPSHHFVVNGTYTVTLTATSSNGCITTYSSSIVSNNSQGLNNVKGEDNLISVYPNPVSNFLFVTVNKNATIELFDTKMNTVYSSELLHEKKEFQIDVESLADGIYFLRAISDQDFYVKKISIKK